MFHMTVGRPATNDLAEILDHFPDSTFDRLTRSTIPLLAFWRRPLDRLGEIAKSLGISLPSDGALCFEYPEPSGVPRAKASYSDVMYVSDGCRLAFEGKWTEPPYESVTSWLSKGRDADHRRLVLDAWLDRIARLTKATLNANDVSDVAYQLVHRTASACSGAVTTAVVVYQCFCDKSHEHAHVKIDLQRLADRIGATSYVSFHFQRIPLATTEAYSELASRYHTYTPRQRAAAARLALWERDLFDFGPLEVERIVPKRS